jgi:hypothetical protein
MMPERRSRATRILSSIVFEAFDNRAYDTWQAMCRQLGRFTADPFSESARELARLAQSRTRALARRWRVSEAEVRRTIRRGLDGRA